MVGQTVSHYRILEQLGAGGMGVVYKAEDLRLKRPVALKFLPVELTREEDAKERLIHEAQTASALDHPNICVIHEFDETSDGRLFIAMTYYDGQTLRQRLAGGALPVDEATRIALQIAAAAAAAHEAAIIHRDIKPANVIITRRGEAKLLDFGIAKLAGQTRLTRTGTTLGTIAYMAPEQIAGCEADARSDVWAIGVVLFEMLTGRLPFDGGNEISLMSAIVNSTPRSIRGLRPDIAPALEHVIGRALAKEPKDRFPTAKDLVEALTPFDARSTAASGVVVRTTPRWVSRRAALVVGAAVLTVAVPAGWWVARNRSITSTRDAAIPEIRKLISEDRYVEAMAAVNRVLPVLGDDPELTRLWESSSTVRDLRTPVPGATVSVRDIFHKSEWQVIGRTPLTKVRLPLTVARWKIEQAGYDTAEFIRDIRPLPRSDDRVPPPDARASGPVTPAFAPLPQEIELTKAGSAPSGMVQVPEGPMSLALAGYDYNKTIPTKAYFIDRNEVTNREYKEFVDAGGYERQEYWKHPFVKDGRTVSWADAIAAFTDQTGRTGPATWEAGTYPQGQAEHPVGGVSWYEAAAYAAFRGKSLPTIYHWTSASGTPLAAYITPLSNFRANGSVPVRTTGAIGPFGLYDMAGNVKEWCANELASGGQRYVLGGAWNEPDYMFIYADARAPFDRPPTAGFRCVKYAETAGPSDRAMAPVLRSARNYAEEKPSSAEVFRAYKSIHAYDATPLDARVERIDDSSDIWRREKVSFKAAYGKDRVPAYLFIPKNRKPPFPLIVFWPGSSTIRMRSSDDIALAQLDYLVMSGRAVMAPVFYGSYERNDGRQDSWPDVTRSYRDWVVKQLQDARRALDYAETRAEIRPDAFGYVGFSWGGRMGPLVAALDSRVKASVLVSGGLSPGAAPPEVDPFTFAPHVSTPVLMVNGDADFIFPLEQCQKPLFRILGSAADRKKHLVLPGGHPIMFEKRSRVIQEALQWFDRYLGTD